MHAQETPIVNTACVQNVNVALLSQTLAYALLTIYQEELCISQNVIDDFNRGTLGIEVDFSVTATRVTRYLEQLIERYGLPQSIRCDNESELTSGHFIEWAEDRDITIKYIQPGKPTQNAYIERFNRTYQYEILDAYIFRSIKEIKELTSEWLIHYNTVRPHASLGYVALEKYRNKTLFSENKWH